MRIKVYLDTAFLTEDPDVNINIYLKCLPRVGEIVRLTKQQKKDLAFKTTLKYRKEYSNYFEYFTDGNCNLDNAIIVKQVHHYTEGEITAITLTWFT